MNIDSTRGPRAEARRVKGGDMLAGGWQTVRAFRTPVSLKPLLTLGCVLLFAIPLAVHSQTKQELLNWLKGRGHGSYLFGPRSGSGE